MDHTLRRASKRFSMKSDWQVTRRSPQLDSPNREETYYPTNKRRTCNASTGIHTYGASNTAPKHGRVHRPRRERVDEDPAALPRSPARLDLTGP